MTGAVAVLAVTALLAVQSRRGPTATELAPVRQSRSSATLFSPTAPQWATLSVEPVGQQVFRSEHVTEGKIAIDEDRSTLIFSPYSGRITKLLVKQGDTVAAGQPLFVVEATDTVQAQNEFIAAVTSLSKAKSQLNLLTISEKRAHDLYLGKAVPLKEWEKAQADLTGAQNDERSGEVSLEAARNRLSILGRSDDQIAALQNRGAINPETTVYAPIGGTVLQRKVGPGQYLSSGGSDPVFVVGDLSTVWLVAYVRETDAPKIKIGQSAAFSVLAYPDKAFDAKISYVGTSLDAASRRLLVRATIANPNGDLKPEMFASVTIFTDDGTSSPAIPRDAVIYEGDTARVWVAHDDKSVEMRRVKVGLLDGRMVQVRQGLNPGERVVTKGSLFIDRAASGS